MLKQKFKIPQLEVKPNSTDPFAEDKLYRKELCENLTNLIENAATPYTLAVNAGWGNGKTVFLQMLRAHLREQGYGCVFFDAWRADFYKDALPALIAEIKEEITDNKKIKDNQGYKKVADAAKNLGKNLISPDTLSTIVTTIAKQVPGGEAGVETIKKLWQDHDAVEHYLGYRQALKKFRDALKDATASNGKPLVILVDELDRCRPDFALDVLEKVKHVFDVESVFFVFALNKEQLERTIEKTYGEIGAELYLRKFFDLTIPLVNVVNEANLVTHMVEKIGLDKLLEKSITRKSTGELIEHLGTFFKMFPLSLRDKEQVIATINLFFLRTPLDQHHADELYPIMLVYFPTIKLAKPELFQKSKVGADRNNPEVFPFKEHLEFYKNQAGFEKDEDPYDKEPYKKHLGPYFYLQHIYCRTDSKYQDRCEKKCAEEEAEGFWHLIVDCHPGSSRWSLLNIISEFINKIDSIGKLVARPEEAEKNR